MGRQRGAVHQYGAFGSAFWRRRFLLFCSLLPVRSHFLPLFLANPRIDRIWHISCKNRFKESFVSC